MKATDVRYLSLKGLSALADAIIIATGRSARNVSAIAAKLLETAKKASFEPLGTSGIKDGEWALLDFGEVIVHIMTAECRAFYNLEGLWEVPDHHLSQQG